MLVCDEYKLHQFNNLMFIVDLC